MCGRTATAEVGAEVAVHTNHGTYIALHYERCHIAETVACVNLLATDVYLDITGFLNLEGTNLNKCQCVACQFHLLGLAQQGNLHLRMTHCLQRNGHLALVHCPEVETYNRFLVVPVADCTSALVDESRLALSRSRYVRIARQGNNTFALFGR